MDKKLVDDVKHLKDLIISQIEQHEKIAREFDAFSKVHEASYQRYFIDDMEVYIENIEQNMFAVMKSFEDATKLACSFSDSLSHIINKLDNQNVDTD